MKLLKYFAIIMILFAMLHSCKKKETAIAVPELITFENIKILPSTAQCEAQISSTGGADLIERGFCWSTHENPQISDSVIVCTDTVQFTGTITNLIHNTRYYVRAFATNNAGVGYGNEISFLANKVGDVNGNIYNSVAIGTQVWLVENLKVTKYRNGDNIEHLTDTAAWRRSKGGLFANYEDDAAQVALYGRLYNWAAVMDERGIAPQGWHVPSRKEWETLIEYLGGKEHAGGAMKEIGLTHWDQPNIGASNSSGFTALPCGYFYFYKTVTSEAKGYFSYWWSSTEENVDNAYTFNLVNSASRIMTDNPTKISGFSVRCIKD